MSAKTGPLRELREAVATLSAQVRTGQDAINARLDGLAENGRAQAAAYDRLHDTFRAEIPEIVDARVASMRAEVRAEVDGRVETIGSDLLAKVDARQRRCVVCVEQIDAQEA